MKREKCVLKKVGVLEKIFNILEPRDGKRAGAKRSKKNAGPRQKNFTEQNFRKVHKETRRHQ